MRRIFIWEDLAAVAAVSAAAVTVAAVIMEQVSVAAVVSEVAVVHAEAVLAVAVLAAVQDHTDQGQDLDLDLTMIMVRGHIITEDPVCPLPHHQEEDIMVAEQPMYMQMEVPEAVPAVHLLQLFCSCSS